MSYEQIYRKRGPRELIKVGRSLGVGSCWVFISAGSRLHRVSRHLSSGPTACLFQSTFITTVTTSQVLQTYESAPFFYPVPTLVNGGHRPIQLLLPAGLCKAVCPILILSSLSGSTDELLSVLLCPHPGGASIIGLANGRSLRETPREFDRMRLAPAALAGIVLGRKDSAIHSYHTLCVSVSLHM